MNMTSPPCFRTSPGRVCRFGPHKWTSYSDSTPKNEAYKQRINSFWDSHILELEGKYTEWPNPQIRGENRQSGLTD